MSTSALTRAERHLETADGLDRTASVTARDHDAARRRPPRDMRREAKTRTRAALHDLTGYYRHGLRTERI